MINLLPKSRRGLLRLGLPSLGLPSLGLLLAAGCSGSIAGDEPSDSAAPSPSTVNAPATGGAVDAEGNPVRADGTPVDPGAPTFEGTESPNLLETPNAGGSINVDRDFGPFRRMQIEANDPTQFAAPLAGVELADRNTAFLAFKRDNRGYGLFRTDNRNRVTVLNAGEQFVAPVDLDRRGSQLLVADRAAGQNGAGAVFTFSAEDGTLSNRFAEGFRPAGLAVDGQGLVFFSGRDRASGQPGIFQISGNGAVAPVFVGSPLVDPSGIAAKSDGTLLVTDTSFEGSSQGSVFSIDRGVATLVATGFATGFPAGAALTTDESTLVLSAEAPEGFDRLLTLDLATGEQRVVATNFVTAQGSAGALHRQADSNTFIWSSGGFNGGTVFRLED